MPAYDYDLMVIGGGAAGFVASKFANGLGKQVVMIERKRLGGECTNHVCIPSKALIYASSVAYHTNNLGKYGLHARAPLNIDAGHVMAHVRSIVQKVYDGHKPEVFRGLGIDVLFGTPRFIDNHSVYIDGKTLSSKAAIIATGSSPLIPPIEGIASVPYVTNETIFDLEMLPKSMAILGGGPIGMELASALNRLGVEITVIEMGDHILPREDKGLVQILAERLEGEGLHIMTETRATRCSREGEKIVLHVEDGKNRRGEIRADSLLVAAGRRANVEDLDLERAGVEYTSKGIKTDHTLRTTAGNILACGDVVGPYQFSHMAEYQAIIAARNALLPFKKKTNYDTVAWCTFTDPELAHAGLTELEAREKYGDGIKVYVHEYRNIDRGKTDVSESGMSKFICDRKGRLIGAHILGNRAGDLIHEAQLVKSLGIPFYKVYPVIHIYPTFTDITKHPSRLCYIDRLRGNILLKVLSLFLMRKG